MTIFCWNLWLQQITCVVRRSWLYDLLKVIKWSIPTEAIDLFVLAGQLFQKYKFSHLRHRTISKECDN